MLRNKHQRIVGRYQNDVGVYSFFELSFEHDGTACHILCQFIEIYLFSVACIAIFH